MLLWHGQVPFCYSLMCKKKSSLSHHSIRICVKGKRTNCGVAYRLETPSEYIFVYLIAMRKLFDGQREHGIDGNEDGVDGNVKKVLRCLK